jgi:RNA polymerase sigma-70 factor (ECF subfamily)
MMRDSPAVADQMNVATFEENRPRLQALAYGMLGTVMDAEDVVQDAYLRWSGVDAAAVDSPAAYLTTVTTRLAIDRLRSAQRRRETYVGPWLPEPLVTGFEEDPATVVAEAERLSMAMLTAFERLNPVERAVLLLREVFDLDYAEIADIVERSPENTRQIASRARGHVGDATRHRAHDPAQDTELVNRYLEAILAGDVDRVAEVFSADVVLWSDGGGKVRAARHLLNGAERVARHLVGVTPQTPPGTQIALVRVNGEPGILGTLDGVPIGLISFEVVDGKATAVRAQLNPDKLAGVEAP